MAYSCFVFNFDVIFEKGSAISMYLVKMISFMLGDLVTVI